MENIESKKIRKPRAKLHKWTKEEIDYLKEIAPGKKYKEILALLKEKFDLDINVNQLDGVMQRNKIRTGLKGYFPKGNKPWNTGTKGLVKPSSSCFQKGYRPKNTKPVGSERIDVDGYTYIKIAEPNIWKLKHRLIYEEKYGKIPKNHSILFADGNKTNFDINNLVLVSKNQVLKLNQFNLIYNDAELTKTGVNIVKLIEKISIYFWA